MRRNADVRPRASGRNLTGRGYLCSDIVDEGMLFVRSEVLLSDRLLYPLLELSYELHLSPIRVAWIQSTRGEDSCGTQE
jgi:hypothetical protein